MTAIRYRLDDHPALDAAADAAVAQLATLDAVARLWAHDFTLFSDDPTEIENRLGWLEVASDSLQRWPARFATARSCSMWRVWGPRPLSKRPASCASAVATTRWT